MAAKFQIAPETPDDVRGIITVLYKAWLVTYPNAEYGITLEDIEEWYKDYFDEEKLVKREKDATNPPVGEQTLVAREEGIVVGMCRVINRPDQNQLQALYVLPEYQGKGLGTALWEEGRKFLDSKRDIELWTAVYNHKAQEFYRKLGFKETGKTDIDPKFKMPISGNFIPEIEMVFKVENK